MKPKITVEVVVDAPVDRIWKYWNEPKHIVEWYHASDDWHVPKAVNDLRAGGAFGIRMEAKDGSAGFDFTGRYTEVNENERITYDMPDGRKVFVDFTKESDGSGYRITEIFDPEDQNPLEMQKAGWQAILENFKKYVEA